MKKKVVAQGINYLFLVVAPWIKINDSNNCLKKNPMRKTKSNAKFVKFSKSVITVY